MCGRVNCWAVRRSLTNKAQLRSPAGTKSKQLGPQLTPVCLQTSTGSVPIFLLPCRIHFFETTKRNHLGRNRFENCTWLRCLTPASWEDEDGKSGSCTKMWQRWGQPCLVSRKAINVFVEFVEMSKQEKYSNTGVSPVTSLIDNVHAISESYFVVHLVGLHLDNLYDVK